jgi:hypothetical protein
MSNLVTKKKWTIMVYLAGDNNLDANGVIDLIEMKKAGTTADINVIAQFDRAGAGLPTTRYLLKKGTTLMADVVDDSLGETNTGKPEFLYDFVKWGASNYQAEHYLLILWNHGQGWDDTDIFAGERVRGPRLSRSGRISHAFFKTTVTHAAKLSASDIKVSRAILIDDDAKDFLDCLELKQVLEDLKSLLGQKIDILGMDACLMSMAEVGYQMRNSVHYTVGSEETEPLDGWPYDAILGYLAANPGITPRELSTIIVKKYVEYYKLKDEAVTQSACDLTVSDSLAMAMSALTKVLIQGLSDSKTLALIANARNRSQEYQVNDNVDLVSFCNLLKALVVSKAISNACDLVITAVKEKQGLVFSAGYNGESMMQSYGLAIYFPTRTISPLYARLDFVQKTGWGEFLKEYIMATQ